MADDDWFDKALQETTAELDAQEGAAASPTGSKGLVESYFDFGRASAVGVAQSIFETKDFFVGEPTTKSQIRQDIEGLGQQLAEESPLNALAMGVSQFLAGMVGAGKIVAAAKTTRIGTKAAETVAKGGRATAIAGESAKAAAVGAVVFDPHQERLANLVEEYPALSNPITRYLAADPSDSAAEGRFKAALESIGLDAVLIGAFGLAAKGFKLLKAGDEAGAQKALAEAAPPSPPPTSGGDLEVVRSPTAGMAEAGVKPGKLKPLTLDDADIDPLVATLAKDTDTLLRYGSRAAAIATGNDMGGAKIPWQKIDAPEELQSFLARTADHMKPTLDKTKGGETLTDARLQRLVEQRVALYNEDPNLVRGMLQGAGKEATTMAANMEAADAIALKMAEEAYEVVAKMRVGNLAEWGGDVAAARSEFAKRAGLAMTVFGAGRSMLSNAGRTLRVARGDTPRLAFREIQKIEGLPAERLAQLFEDTRGDIRAIKDILNKPTLVRRITDAGSWLLVNNLLWGWKTHLVNTASNAYMMGSRPLEKIIGSFAVEGGTAIRKQAIREYRFMAATMADSFQMAARTFMRGDSILAPHDIEVHQVARRVGAGQEIVWKPTKNIGDVAHNAMLAAGYTLGLPTRALGTLDEMIKQVRYRSMVMAEASMEADELGLRRQAWRQHVDRRLGEAFDTEGRALNGRALQDAKVTTFTNELDPGGPSSLIQAAVVKFPLFRLVLPFVRTPVNVLKYGVKLTPGLNLAQKEYREALKGALGAEQQAHAIGQMTLGTLFLGTAATMVANGSFTGSGPKDPRKRRELMAAGWQPNSVVRRNEDGTTEYFPLYRFDPLGLPFGMIADIMDIMQHPEKTEVGEVGALAVLVALAKQITDRTYLRNLNEFVKALSDPDRYGDFFAGRTAANLVPMSSMLRHTNPDPFMREARDMVDHLMSTVPGLSERLPPKFDAFGDPILVRKGLGSTVEDDVVDQEIIRMGMDADQGLTAPSPYRKGADLREIPLEDGRSAYTAYQEYAGHPPRGPSLKASLAKVIKSPAYQRAGDGSPSTKGTRQWLLSGIVSKYREAAHKRLQRESKVYREALQEAELKSRAAWSAGAKDPQKTGDKARIKALGDAYGLDLRTILPPPQ